MNSTREGLSKIVAPTALTICAVLNASTPVLAREAAATPKPEIVRDLAGPISVWSQNSKSTINLKALARELANMRYVILGEVHDNSEHHRLRARLVKDLIDARKSAAPNAAAPAAVFEHATTARQPQLTALNQRLDDNTSKAVWATPDDFFKAANWVQRGWPDPSTFRPLIAEILSARMPLYGGDVQRDKLRKIVGGSQSVEAEVFSKADYARLKLDQPLNEFDNNAAMSVIAKAHCNVLPDSMLAPMAFGQRLRDATLADIVIMAAERHGAAVLFTGNEHARTDRGVPWYLGARGKRQVKSVVFKEAAGAGVPIQPDVAADYVIYTPARPRADPCEKLMKKYGKSKR